MFLQHKQCNTIKGKIKYHRVLQVGPGPLLQTDKAIVPTLGKERRMLAWVPAALLLHARSLASSVYLLMYVITGFLHESLVAVYLI